MGGGPVKQCNRCGKPIKWAPRVCYVCRERIFLAHNIASVNPRKTFFLTWCQTTTGVPSLRSIEGGKR